MVLFEHIKDGVSQFYNLKMKSSRLYLIFAVLINKISSNPAEEHLDHLKDLEDIDESKLLEFSNFGYGSISKNFSFLEGVN